MKSKLSTAPANDERIVSVIPQELKLRLFDAAAAKGISASQLVREGIKLAVAEHRAADEIEA